MKKLITGTIISTAAMMGFGTASPAMANGYGHGGAYHQSNYYNGHRHYRGRGHYRGSRHYRSDRRHHRAQRRYYRGDRSYKRRCDKGTGGTIVGAIAGGLLGSRVAGYGNRTEGAILGGAVGAVAGRAIDRNC